MDTISIPKSAARRIRREGHSAARRELALALHLQGKTLVAIAAVLGVSATRVHQMIGKAERRAAALRNRKGAPRRKGALSVP